MSLFRELTGKVFGNLKVLRQTRYVVRRRSRMWKCLCFCGNTIEVSSSELNRGRRVNCGCQRGVFNPKHRSGKYSENDIKRNAAKVRSMAKLLESLNIKAAGGNYANMKRLLQYYNVDCTHWTGSAWNKGKQLKDWSDYSRCSNSKKHLITKRGHGCESCGLKLWKKAIIPLEVHHLDGDRTNNKEENLQLVCPNCHALTGNWRGRQNASVAKRQKRTV